MLAIHFIRDVWKSRKDKLKENTEAIISMTATIKELNKSVAEIPKIQKDLNRYFDAIKLLSGDKWSEISKKIIEEEILRG